VSGFTGNSKNTALAGKENRDQLSKSWEKENVPKNNGLNKRKGDNEGEIPILWEGKDLHIVA